jgi:predicted ATPase
MNRCANDDQRGQRLSSLIVTKTHGNPFFVIEFIRSLYSQGILNFDATAGRWEWDEERAIQTKISKNVVDLMASNIRSLPSYTQNLLKLASCIGITYNTINPSLIRVIMLPECGVSFVYVNRYRYHI